MRIEDCYVMTSQEFLERLRSNNLIPSADILKLSQLKNFNSVVMEYESMGHDPKKLSNLDKIVIELESMGYEPEELLEKCKRKIYFEEVNTVNELARYMRQELNELETRIRLLENDEPNDKTVSELSKVIDDAKRDIIHNMPIWGA